MARGKKNQNKKNSNGANLGFEEKLWQAADKMRGHMDPAEYKHVALGLIFLKYISDAFEERHKHLEFATAEPSSELYVREPEERYGVIEERDEYTAENVFWVPKAARWAHLQAKAKQPTIGKLIDDAMVAIEKENPSLKGVLAKDYARPSLDKQRLGELIDFIGTIGLGDKESRSKDILGRVYEYFLSKFASAEGKKGGEFYTPRCIVKLLVEMIEPYQGRVYDPCCGSSGMFVQSVEFIEAHASGNGNGGKAKGAISIYGQESNSTTWRLAKMNLAIRGIEANLGPNNADTFHNDLHKDLKADFILANPPFNQKETGVSRLRNDVRWKFGIPDESKDGGNYAWMQHMIHHLAPNGIAGFVMANGAMSAGHTFGKIRQAIIEADLVDCMIALPGQLFYGSQIPACLWFLARNKNKEEEKRFFHVIENLMVTTIYPLVLYIYKNVTDQQIRNDMLRMLESCLVRRNVCRLTTKNYNLLFIQIINKLEERRRKAAVIDSQALAEVIGGFGDPTNLIPADGDFQAAFRSEILSNQNAREILFLIALYQVSTELSDIPELSLGNYSVEHMMPIKWEANWLDREMNIQEKADRNRKVKTLGNLTLVTKKLNSTMQNSAWTNKKEHLRKNSSLRMTVDYLDKEKWDEACIDERADQLASAARKIWKWIGVESPKIS